MRCLRLLLPAATLVLVFACSSDPKKPPPASDGTFGGGGGGGGVSEAGGGEGGIDGGVDGGVCTVLPNTGVLVPKLGVAQDPPPQTGGTIADGTYDLKDVAVYLGATGVGGPTGLEYKESIRITGGTLERVRDVKNGNTNKTSSTDEAFHFAASQNNFALAMVCPLNTAALPDQYTATDIQLTILESLTKEVFVYQKH
jgi:hypothetical protein